MDFFPLAPASGMYGFAAPDLHFWGVTSTASSSKETAVARGSPADVVLDERRLVVAGGAVDGGFECGVRMGLGVLCDRIGVEGYDLIRQ